MNEELGFGRRVLEVLEKHGMVFEHLPSGIDTMSIVLSTAQLEGHREAVRTPVRLLRSHAGGFLCVWAWPGVHGCGRLISMG